MKLIILATTMLLSILAGSLSVTIVSWATGPALTARSQIEGSPACNNVFTQTNGATSDSLVISRAGPDQLLELPSESASMRNNPTWSCTTIGAVPADFSALADLQAGR